MTGISPLTHATRFAYRRLLRPVFFRLYGGDAEQVHELTVRGLGKLPAKRRVAESDPVEVAGIRFPNRVGLAAGMDKDGLAAAAWARLGFGFAELGTVTGRAQPGNEKPRLYRLQASRALVNRMGFNNRGAMAMAKQLQSFGIRRGNSAVGIPIGISVGKTKKVPLQLATDDYLRSIRILLPYADYFAVNISSPNTPGLRRLQAAHEVADLLPVLVQAAGEGVDTPTPIFVKLAPDLDGQQLRETIAAIRDSGAAGIIATNTTLSRDGVAPQDAKAASQAGGLSGAPLTSRALSVVNEVASVSELPVIGVGGLMSPADAMRMFDAGAVLCQLYSGFVYEGIALIRGIKELRRSTA